MKRMILVLIVAALAVPSAFAQFVGPFVPPFVPGSMEYGMTVGLFENEIDQAFQANADFGAFANNFLFAGLGNPTAGLGTFTGVTAFNATFNPPVRLGYYMAGSMPISLYSSMDFTAFTPITGRSILGTTTTPTYGPVATVTSGTTSTVYNWVQSSFTDVATNVKLANPTEIDANFVIPAGAATGTQTVTVTNSSGTSNSAPFTVVIH